MCGFLGVCFLLILFCLFSEIDFQPFVEFTAGQHHAPSAAFTFEADIRAETCDRPFVGTAWMLLAQAQVVVKFEVRKHIHRIISLVLQTKEPIVYNNLLTVNFMICVNES